MAKKTTSIVEINEESFHSFVYQFRGVPVMLDSDLAEIYGYTTKGFNRQVKNNFERFDEEDFMFQLTQDEFDSLRSRILTANSEDTLICKNCISKGETMEDGVALPSETFENEESILRCKFCTSKSAPTRGGRQYLPYVFTEQGVYMLTAVLKGEIAVRQSKSLMRMFKRMKDYILQNQPLLGQREFLQLSLQTSDNIRDIMEIRSDLAKLDDKVAKMADEMGEVVTHSELSNIMLDFSQPVVRRGWLILNGQPVESDLAYKQIYALARKSIYVIDNYINLKTLALMCDVPSSVEVKVISDNVQKKLHKVEFDDFVSEYPDLNVTLLTAGGVFHDRYIVLDYDTNDEKIYHCGASSKDGGNKVMTISLQEDAGVYHPLIDRTLRNPQLVLV